jgi:ABC-type bacteriocin/lantibiotic exporter with double-glycine peptidase domain
MLPIKSFRQKYSYDCGGAVYVSLLQAYGYLPKKISVNKYRKILKDIKCTPIGLSKDELLTALNKFNLNAEYYNFVKQHKLAEYNSKGYPIIVSWHSITAHGAHYSIVVDIDNSTITLIDPNFKKHSIIDINTFYDNWFIIDVNSSKKTFKHNPLRVIDIRPIIVLKTSLLSRQ